MKDKSYSFRLYPLQYSCIFLILLCLASCRSSKDGVSKEQLESIDEKATEEEEKITIIKGEDLHKLEKEDLFVEKKVEAIRIETDEIHSGTSPINTSAPTPIVPVSKPAHLIDKYKVGLEADSIMKFGGVYTLKVLVGPEDITLSYAQDGKVNDEIIISTKNNQYAIITPHTPGFDVEPRSTGCILLDSSEIGYLFKLTPTAVGTFNISANVELFDNNECSGSKTAKIASDLEITVEVATKPNLDPDPPSPLSPNKTTWEEIQDLFKENFKTFMGSLFALFFGYLLFLIRKKLKKKTGYDPEQKES